MNPEPFHFVPGAEDVHDLQARLARSRLPPAAPDPQQALGIDPAALSRLLGKFAALDWDALAMRINNLPNYTIMQEDDQLHFVHQPSAQPGAIPLLLLHGWPGSFLEFADIISPLAAGSPAFHVVCPSLPGYGFSTRSLEKPYGLAAIADSMVKLMRGLGYESFVAQGGDWGSRIATEIARRHPDACAGLHLNMVGLKPPAGDDGLACVLPGEFAWLKAEAQMRKNGLGYFRIQSTRPQTLAYALADSPSGLVAWIGEKFLEWSDRDANGESLVADEKIIENIAVYWITQTIGSSIRLYYDFTHNPAPQTNVAVPTGVAVFPREIAKAPRAWVARGFNLVRWTEYDRGGHFAALEVPDLLVGDIRAFVQDLKLPGQSPHDTQN